MDSDIQFGEVTEALPKKRRRPDRDRHFVVAAYGAPSGSDLPVFVDMDVLADMEAHARSDPTVELGGVMLGGQFEDEEGKPFVVVLDSLRAQHYESSQGHFKFTHDTWERISRQRDEFSEDLAMVGWYHTHPNWGVFLSGMDRFICDNFFNRPLDVALVIDPVRDDRGWFYWNPGGGERLPRAKGFGITTSRFRRRELADYVELLEGRTAMRPEQALKGSMPGADPRIPQQVIHTIQPQLGWIGVAVVALLVLQFCTTLMIGFRLGGAGSGGKSTSIEEREERLAAREEVFENLVGRIKVDPDGKVNVAALAEDNRRLRREVDRLERSDILLDELTGNLQRIADERDDLAADLEKLRADFKDLTASLEEQEKSSEKEIARLEKKLARATRKEKKDADSTAAKDSATTSVAGSISLTDDDAGDGISIGSILLVTAIGLLAFGIVAVAIVRKRGGFADVPDNSPPVDGGK